MNYDLSKTLKFNISKQISIPSFVLDLFLLIWYFAVFSFVAHFFLDIAYGLSGLELSNMFQVLLFEISSSSSVSIFLRQYWSIIAFFGLILFFRYLKKIDFFKNHNEQAFALPKKFYLSVNAFLFFFYLAWGFILFAFLLKHFQINIIPSLEKPLFAIQGFFLKRYEFLYFNRFEIVSPTFFNKIVYTCSLFLPLIVFIKNKSFFIKKK